MTVKPVSDQIPVAQPAPARPAPPVDAKNDNDGDDGVKKAAPQRGLGAIVDRDA